LNCHLLAWLIGKGGIVLGDIRPADSDAVCTGGDGHARAFLSAILEDQQVAVRAIDRRVDYMVVVRHLDARFRWQRLDLYRDDAIACGKDGETATSGGDMFGELSVRDVIFDVDRIRTVSAKDELVGLRINDDLHARNVRRHGHRVEIPRGCALSAGHM
jgi:hypothetical protein